VLHVRYWIGRKRTLLLSLDSALPPFAALSSSVAINFQVQSRRCSEPSMKPALSFRTGIVWAFG
jgi:hypothetical protein